MPSRRINAKKVAKTTNKLRKDAAFENAAQRTLSKVKSGEIKEANVTRDGHTFREGRALPYKQIKKDQRAEKKDAKDTLKKSGMRQTLLVNKSAGTPASKVLPRLNESRGAAMKKAAAAGMSDKKMQKVMGRSAAKTAKKLYRGNK